MAWCGLVIMVSLFTRDTESRTASVIPAFKRRKSSLAFPHSYWLESITRSTDTIRGLIRHSTGDG
jgi:hypothetical protein